MMPSDTRQSIETSTATQSKAEEGLPIFAARYQAHAVAILKDSDFSATITSVCSAFPALATIPASRIHLLSRFDDFGDILVEIRHDVWKNILPLLKVVEVSVDAHTSEGNIALTTPQVPANNITDPVWSDKITIHIIGGPADLKLPISETSTVQQLKEMVFQLEPRLPKSLGFNHQAIDLADDGKQLHEYGVIDQSIISIATNIQVYVTTPERSKVPMRITLYAGVSSLKLLINARLEIPVHEQILVCAGEELDDAMQLGSYHQITHNCQIFVDKATPTQSNQILAPVLYRIEVKPEWAADDDDEDGDSHMVLPSSTVLDLKVLISNLNMITPSRQYLEFRGQSLEDNSTLDHYLVRAGDVLTMKVNSQRT